VVATDDTRKVVRYESRHGDVVGGLRVLRDDRVACSERELLNLGLRSRRGHEVEVGGDEVVVVDVGVVAQPDGLLSVV